jgi:hypothetical protein
MSDRPKIENPPMSVMVVNMMGLPTLESVALKAPL